MDFQKILVIYQNPFYYLGFSQDSMTVFMIHSNRISIINNHPIHYHKKTNQNLYFRLHNGKDPRIIVLVEKENGIQSYKIVFWTFYKIVKYTSVF